MLPVAASVDDVGMDTKGQDMTTPQPLPVNSRKLRDRRYDTYVNGPRNERGAYPAIAHGRFATFEAAKAWADATHPDAFVVNITVSTARSGWVARQAGQRIDGVWMAR